MSVVAYAYPIISLKKAGEYVSSIAKKSSTLSVTRRELLEYLGYSLTSGRGSNVISALIQYGLIYRLGNDYAVSELAWKSIKARDPKDKLSARKEAFLMPQLFNKLFIDWDGSELKFSPLELAERYGIAKSAAAKVRKAYNESLDFVFHSLDVAETIGINDHQYDAVFLDKGKVIIIEYKSGLEMKVPKELLLKLIHDLNHKG